VTKHERLICSSDAPAASHGDQCLDVLDLTPAVAACHGAAWRHAHLATLFRRKTILACFDAASLDQACQHQSSCLPVSNMANSRDREDALTARVAKLEAELAASKRETEAWRSMLVRTARVLAAFTSRMDDSLESFRSPSSPIVVPDSVIDAARVEEPPDGLN
jgi:hypothetical protein